MARDDRSVDATTEERFPIAYLSPAAPCGGAGGNELIGQWRRLTRPAAGTTEIPIDVLEATDSVVYIMCGLGENCAISEGVPSTERMRLLRREALELYTFRYLDGKNSVAFLPPRAGDDPSYALSSPVATSRRSSTGRCERHSPT